MAKTKQQRAVAHQRQLERSVRKRQGTSVVSCTPKQQRPTLSSLTLSGAGDSQPAFLHRDGRAVRQQFEHSPVRFLTSEPIHIKGQALGQPMENDSAEFAEFDDDFFVETACAFQSPLRPMDVSTSDDISPLQSNSTLEMSMQEGIAVTQSSLLEAEVVKAQALDADKTKAEVMHATSDSEATTEESPMSAGSSDEDDDFSLCEQLCSVAAAGNLEEHEEGSDELDTADLGFQSHEVNSLVLRNAGGIEKFHSSDVASALKEYELAFEAALNLKAQTAKAGHKSGGKQPSVTAARLHVIGKAKLQIHDVTGALCSLSEADSICRQMGTLQTHAGARLLLDIGIAKLQSADPHGACNAYEEALCSCKHVVLLHTPAAQRLLHEVGKLRHSVDNESATTICAAAHALTEDLSKAEVFACRDPCIPSTDIEEAKPKGFFQRAFLKAGHGLLHLCSGKQH